MITKYLTEVTAKLNPFSPCAKSARLFLTHLPPDIRSHGTAVSTQLIPRSSKESSSVIVKFKDGKQLEFDGDKMTIKGMINEVDRLSRQLQKMEDISG
ncbi:ribosomal protein L44 [Ophiocordyceps camponoti-floridani]|uniref:Large ribosomal subunit protein mL53 n=1 Tax=Ophiocordyceps camponoti-floridani TaxID=2030778 RepID=A0A8H4VG57_9HYPO|nr:ribosomal protein L44 [Ophiocordyceps camponoti-floridani]